MNTEAAVYDGQAGIDTGLADQLINAADAVEVMVSALNDSVTKENTMTVKNLTVAEAVAQDNQRVRGILNCLEAKGREQLAQALTEQPGMTVAQAKTLLAAAPAASQPSQETLFDRFMAQHAASAVSGGGTAGRGEEDLLMSMP